MKKIIFIIIFDAKPPKNKATHKAMQQIKIECLILQNRSEEMN